VAIPTDFFGFVITGACPCLHGTVKIGSWGRSGHPLHAAVATDNALGSALWRANGLSYDDC
jgi:hypothetical protein